MAQSVATVDEVDDDRLTLMDFLCEDVYNFCYYDDELHAPHLI